ncbi:hypothetical protein PspLS_09756 [Pyricularia sp. CBS 133598]|nr:hypothetical protein PspLS_09756 [Pyricularia sp. CBS 133598]
MASRLKFVTLDVFTTTPYEGNPLGVVHLPPDQVISQSQKQTISREFNLSETVFIHDVDPSNDTDPTTRHIDIFLTTAEIPFAGHPTIGTAAYLQSRGITKIVTKAGPIPISFGPEEGAISALIPHNTKLNSKKLADLDDAALVPGQLHPNSDVRAAELSAPLFSIVKGMTFSLVELSSLELLTHPRPGPYPCEIKTIMDAEWSDTFVGRYYFVVLDDGVTSDGVRKVKIRSRMVETEIEDPATGSAASALASYLSLNKYREDLIQLEIVQGVEMGRKSAISVEVTLENGADGLRSIKYVRLGGRATLVMQGTIAVPPERTL